MERFCRVRPPCLQPAHHFARLLPPNIPLLPSPCCRLGRTMSARSGDTAAAAAAGAAAPPAPPQQQPGSLPAIATRQAKSGSIVPSLKLGIPKLGLAGLGRSLAAAAAAGAAAASAEQPSAAARSLESRPQSRVHFSPTPSPSRQLPSGDAANQDSDSDSSDDDNDACGGAPGFGGRSADVGGGEGSGSGSQRQTLMGLDVPAGFTFSGDLEEDLDRLEALEDGEDQVGPAVPLYCTAGYRCNAALLHVLCSHPVRLLAWQPPVRHLTCAAFPAAPCWQDTDADSERYGPESESASPTIPALRSTPFQQSSGPVPPLMLGLPRFKSQLPSSSAQQADRQGSGGERGAAAGVGGGMAVPRLNLTHSMHSTLEARNASAEMQVQCAAAGHLALCSSRAWLTLCAAVSPIEAQHQWSRTSDHALVLAGSRHFLPCSWLRSASKPRPGRGGVCWESWSAARLARARCRQQRAPASPSTTSSSSCCSRCRAPCRSQVSCRCRHQYCRHQYCKHQYCRQASAAPCHQAVCPARPAAAPPALRDAPMLL